MLLQSSAARLQLPLRLDLKHDRAQVEELIEDLIATTEGLIAMLDAHDAPFDDREPEPNEEAGDYEPTDEEDRWVPVSLNVECSPPRQVRSARWLRAHSAMRAM